MSEVNVTQVYKPDAISIAQDGVVTVRIDHDGSVHFAECLTPSDAAREVWNGIAGYYRDAMAAARLEGVRLGLEAAAEACGRRWVCVDAIRCLDPAAIIEGKRV